MDFSLIELSRTGAYYRDSACDHLQKAQQMLEEVQGILGKQKGIGTEFLIKSIDEFKGNLINCNSRLKNL